MFRFSEWDNVSKQNYYASQIKNNNNSKKPFIVKS